MKMIVGQMSTEASIDQIIRPPTLTKAVAANLRDAILRGKLAPGHALREEELSSNMGVSRGTVREALRLMREEGLVEVFTHRGVYVTQISCEKAHEVYTLRALLEPYAVRVALQRHAYRPHDLAQLQETVHKLGEYERLGDILSEIRTDQEFHTQICAPCKHQLLLSIQESLQSLMSLFMLSTKIYHADPYNNEEQHQEVLDALLTGIPERGEMVLRQHIERSGESLLRRIKEVTAAQSPV